MNKLAALLAAAAIAALPIVANAGGGPPCPDFTGDGTVTITDILFVVDHYQQPTAMAPSTPLWTCWWPSSTMAQAVPRCSRSSPLTGRSATMHMTARHDVSQ